MKEIITFHHFGLGHKFTIREIVNMTFETDTEGDIIYFTLALKETTEKIMISIDPEDAFLVKSGALIFQPEEINNAKGYTFWKNGVGPYDIEVPTGIF